MKKIDWNLMNLKTNPFITIPQKESKNLIWAGLKKIKKELDSLIINSLTSTETNVVLNMSRWGGGKTHTSYYYSNHDHFPEVDFEYTPPFNLLIITPSEGTNAAYEFYKEVIESIGVTTISKSIKTMRKELRDEKKSLETIQEACKSEDVGRILWLLGDPDEEVSYDASNLFFSSPSASLKKRLRIRRGIESTNDRFVLISTIFRIISGYNENKKLQNPRRIFLWLDEIESLIYYSTRYYKTFTQALRGLIDMTPRNLTFLMNFSFADMDTISTLEFIMGKGLSDRITRKIFFDKLEIPESLEYTRELIQFFRQDDTSKTDIYFPFTEKGLEILFKKFEETVKEPLMPRSINKCCLYTINRAFMEDYFPKKRIINETFAEHITFLEEPLEKI